MWGTSIHDMNTGHIGQGIKTRRDFRDHPAENDAFIDQCLGLRFADFCKVSAISKVNAIYVVSTASRFGFANPDTFVRAAPLPSAFLVFLLPSRRLQDWVRSSRAGRLGHTPADQR